MSMEFTARTPLPYRLVRPWVSTIAVVFSMTPRLGSPARHVVSPKTDLWTHPQGRLPRHPDSARLTGEPSPIHAGSGPPHLWGGGPKGRRGWLRGASPPRSP